MDEKIGVFSPEQARMLWQDYLTRQQLQPRLQKNYPDRRPIREDQHHRVFVKNTSDEDIPSYGCMQITGVDLVADRTVVTVAKPSSTDGEYLFNSQFIIPVVSETSAGVGWAYRYGVVRMLGDEPSAANASYIPIVDSWEVEEGVGPFVVFGRDDFSARALIGKIGSGGSGGGDSCCCCVTVLTPDTTLSTGIETVTFRELCVRLGSIAVPQDHGWLTVTFPATTSMYLEREDNPVTDDFVWDIPSSAFSAVYHDGTDATADLSSPSGTVTFSPYVDGADANCDCPMMRMRIEFDVTIPEPEGVEEP